MCCPWGFCEMPLKVKLTDAVVKNATLPEGKKETVIWDTETSNFGLRVREQSKTYIIFYRPAGAGRSSTSKRVKIGTPGTIATASDARRIAKTMLGQVASGGDPAAERAELKRREKAKLGDLLDRYEVYQLRRRRTGLPGIMSLLRRNLKSMVNRDVKTVAGSELAQIRDRLIEQGTPGAAGEFWSKTRAFFSWCMNKAKVIDTHPTFAYRLEKPTREDKLDQEEVGRALSDEELIKVWMAAPSDHFGRYVRFLILSGCRRTESALSRRKMHTINKGGKPVLVLPKRITKSGRDHNMPITPQIDTLLKSCEADARSDLYFPSWVTGRAMSGWTSQFNKVVERSGVEFTPHDLRRTFRTGLDRLGVDTDIGEICVNHARKGLEAIYNRNTASSEMRDAFQLWSNHVERLVKAKRAYMRLSPDRKVETEEPADGSEVPYIDPAFVEYQEERRLIDGGQAEPAKVDA